MKNKHKKAGKPDELNADKLKHILKFYSLSEYIIYVENLTFEELRYECKRQGIL